MVITSALKPADPNEETLHWLRCIELGKTVYRPPFQVRELRESASNQLDVEYDVWSLGFWRSEIQGLKAVELTRRTFRKHGMVCVFGSRLRFTSVGHSFVNKTVLYCHPVATPKPRTPQSTGSFSRCP